MNPAEIQEIIIEIQSLRIRLESTEEKLKKIYRATRNKNTLEINTIVKIANKVTVYNKLQKKSEGITSVLRKRKFLQVV